MGANAGFEPLSGARHQVELIDGVEWIVVRARRNWFVLPFLSVWLILWTFGGLGAVTALMTGGVADRAFLAIWLLFWALGWAMVGSWVAWQLTGRHMLAAHGGALVYRWAMPLLAKTRRYDAARVRHLASSEAGGLWGFGVPFRYDAPPFLPSVGPGGTIKFDYGARTVRVLPGLDEAEGRMIVDRLARKLPRAAVE